MPSITGLDIGGAHLKAVRLDPDGQVAAALQLPCALWQGLDWLAAALAALHERQPPAELLAVTMTGELADLFPDRATGVKQIAAAATAALPGCSLRFWAGRRGFVAGDAVAAHAGEIASANWLATASLAAARIGDGVLIDLGSTTTDILLLAGGAVAAEGASDRERLATGELVYTGLTRTALMALARAAPFAGRRVALMNELFATTADIHRVLGHLPDAADQHPAADGGAKDWPGSARRLARMVGADLAEGSPRAWRELAAWFARRQLRQIEDALALQLSRDRVAETAPLVGAGCGHFLVRELALRGGRPYRGFADLIDAAPEAAGWVATCAPAVAVARLLADAA